MWLGYMKHCHAASHILIYYVYATDYPAIYDLLLCSIGDEAANSEDSNWNIDSSSKVIKVKTLHISSPILAAKSPFFYKVK